MRWKEKAQAQQQASDYIAAFDHHLELLPQETWNAARSELIPTGFCC